MASAGNASTNGRERKYVDIWTGSLKGANNVGYLSVVQILI
jgi:hypothetical protein